MNKDNFKKLIESILFDGQFRFNMTCFVGKLTTDVEYIKQHDLLASEYGAIGLQQVETTNLFNCDSVGCIAGFATALANDWKTPQWLNPVFQEKDGKESFAVVEDFEEEANKFLGLSAGQGKKLYYADMDSVWKFLKYYEFNRYPNLKYSGEEDGEAEEILDQYCDWDDSEYEIDFLSIDYKTAANVLTRIMNEEIVLGHKDGDIRIKEQATIGE